MQKVRKDPEILIFLELVRQRDVLDPLAGFEGEEALECVASNCDTNVN